jgi:hypothetical protein
MPHVPSGTFKRFLARAVLPSGSNAHRQDEAFPQLLGDPETAAMSVCELRLGIDTEPLAIVKPLE